MKQQRELLVPPAAQEDPKSVEVIRAWIAKEGLHCSLNIGIWKEKEAMFWGILLSDVARHVADALSKEKGTDPAITIATIQKRFNEELESPTAATEGGFVE
jgi:uncharacterized protein DUF5076